MRCIIRNHSIFLISFTITVGLFHSHAWGSTLKYKLKMSGYSDQQIEEILRGKKALQQVQRENRSKLTASNTSYQSVSLKKRHNSLATRFFNSYLKRHKKDSEKTNSALSCNEVRKNIKERFFYHKRPPKYDLIEQIENERKEKVHDRKEYSHNPFVEKVKPYLNYVEDASYENNVKKSLILAVITVESGFNHRAVSPKGAQGLMQLMPFTAKSMGVENPFDPMQNIHGGTRYLSQCLKKLDNIKLALAAYNAGITRVSRLCKIPPFRETQNFVKKVLRYEKMYDQMIRNL
ncbi:lytic transglycosylase [Candidatus Magnetomorum sp. HK-1]|nr:lytic transglycosylase [Candidatus Magnetomorum sp. HK-1]